MDSCIEELACLIHERSKRSADNIYSASGSHRGDLYYSYRQIEAKAAGILQVLRDYRADHPEEYEEPARDEAYRLRGEVISLRDQLIDARQMLARYQEREKTMGWSQG